MGCNSCVAFQTNGQPGLYFLSVLPVACEGGLGCAGPTQLTVRGASEAAVQAAGDAAACRAKGGPERSADTRCGARQPVGATARTAVPPRRWRGVGGGGGRDGRGACLADVSNLVGFVRKVKFAQTRPGPTQRQCRGGVRRDGPVRSKGEGSRQESASVSGRCPEGAASGGWGSAACKRM